MATPHRNNAPTTVFDEVSTSPARSQSIADRPAPKWVNEGDPLVKTLLDLKYYKRHRRSSAASDYTVARWHALEDAMSRVVVEAGKTSEGSPRPFREELDELVVLRFEDEYLFKTYTSEVILSVGLDAYRAGVSAGMALVKQPEKPVLNPAEITAVAFSDHDCPGCRA